MPGELSSLQRRILVVLSGVSPPFTLTGGGALVGMHLAHRATRDLDLFFQGHAVLPDTTEIMERLRSAALSVDAVQTSPAFVSLRVGDGREVTLVDLVADPVPNVHPPRRMDVDGAPVLVDVPEEILVNKLCALLSRSEFRDLVDTEALLSAGLALAPACVEAERKDGGFSAATLAWVLQDMPVGVLGRAAGAAPDAIAAASAFRDRLVDELVALSRPG